MMLEIGNGRPGRWNWCAAAVRVVPLRGGGAREMRVSDGVFPPFRPLLFINL